MVPFRGARHSCGCATGYGTEQRRPNRCTALPEWRLRNARCLRTGGVGQGAGIAGLRQADIAGLSWSQAPHGLRWLRSLADGIPTRTALHGRKKPRGASAQRIRQINEAASATPATRCGSVTFPPPAAAPRGTSRVNALTEVHREPAARPGIRRRSTEADEGGLWHSSRRGAWRATALRAVFSGAADTTPSPFCCLVDQAPELRRLCCLHIHARRHHCRRHSLGWHQRQVPASRRNRRPFSCAALASTGGGLSS